MTEVRCQSTSKNLMIHIFCVKSKLIPNFKTLGHQTEIDGSAVWPDNEVLPKGYQESIAFMDLSIPDEHWKRACDVPRAKKLWTENLNIYTSGIDLKKFGAHKKFNTAATRNWKSVLRYWSVSSISPLSESQWDWKSVATKNLCLSWSCIHLSTKTRFWYWIHLPKMFNRLLVECLEAALPKKSSMSLKEKAFMQSSILRSFWQWIQKRVAAAGRCAIRTSAPFLTIKFI